jgi:RNA polymerase sigma factor (sigma-70 family)
MINENHLKNQWDEYYPKVYGYFYRRLTNREDVEDLTSVTMMAFLDTINNPSKSEIITNKHAYLWKIAYNQLNTFLKQGYKLPIQVGLNDNIDTLDKQIDSCYSNRYQDKIADLKQCFQSTLSSEDFELVQLSIIDNLSSQEVANISGFSAANVRQKLSRNLKKLKKACQELYSICFH